MNKSKPKSLSRTLFNNARYHYNAAKVLEWHMFNSDKSNPKINKINGGDCAASYMLCTTFCLELLLKTLILINHENIYSKQDADNNKIPLNGHKYSLLFERINSTIKERIISLFNQNYNSSITIDDFTGLLKTIGDDGFIEWRYAYEKESLNINIQLQDKIINCLGLTIENLFKNYK